jgi:PAS domain S-box-containing protein
MVESKNWLEYRVEENLEKRYKTLFEYSNDAIIIADFKTGNYVDVNKKAEELTGYSMEELLLMSVGDLTSEDMKEDIIKQFESINRPVKIEIELIRKDGKIVPAEISSAILEIDNKKYVQGILEI